MKAKFDYTYTFNANALINLLCISTVKENQKYYFTIQREVSLQFV